MTEPLNHHEALIYVMVASSAVDRAMTGDEFARIGEMVSNLPVFADCDEVGLVKAAEACGKILSLSANARWFARLCWPFWFSVHQLVHANAWPSACVQ
jgi:hypothetical protein